MIWTDERIERLKALYADTHTKWSASQIAEKLGGGLSRNAIIGKLYRMGMQRGAVDEKTTHNRNGLAGKRASLGIGSAVQKINAAVQKINSPAAPKVKPEPFVCAPVVDLSPLHLTLIELKDEMCRYPYGDDPATMTFCGHPTVSGRSWCPKHFAVVTVPTPARRQSTAFIARGAAA